MKIRGKKDHPKKTIVNSQRRAGRPTTGSNRSKQQVLARLKQHHQFIQKAMEEQISRLSSLEKLPVELIQHVFFYSLELNLMRASKSLHQALSTKPIRDALVIFAYFDDDGQSPVEVKHFLPAEYWRLSCNDKIRLQRSLFQTGMTTYDRLNARLPSLSRLVMAQAWHREHLLEEMHEETWSVTRTKIEMVVTVNDLSSIAHLPNLSDEAEVERHFSARAARIPPKHQDRSPGNIDRQQPDYLPRIITWTSSIDDDHVVHKGWDENVTTVACRHIPNLLLTGPWQANDLEMLKLLRQGYSFIQEDHTMDISAKSVFIGMQHAIETGNVHALTILLDLHAIFFKAGSWGMANMMSIEYIAASNHPLPIGLFHLATRQQKAVDLLSLLIRGGIDSISLDDEILTAWASEAQRGDESKELATFLLRHMEGNVNYGLPRRRHLFVDGCLSWRAGGRDGLPFPTCSFANELGYLDSAPIVPAGVDGKVCGAE